MIYTCVILCHVLCAAVQHRAVTAMIMLLLGCCLHPPHLPECDRTLSGSSHHHMKSLISTAAAGARAGPGPGPGGQGTATASSNIVSIRERERMCHASAVCHQRQQQLAQWRLLRLLAQLASCGGALAVNPAVYAGTNP